MKNNPVPFLSSKKVISKRGFTIVEILVGLGILTLSIVAISQLILNDRKVLGNLESHLRADITAQSVNDMIASMPDADFEAFISGAGDAGGWFSNSSASPPQWMVDWIAQDRLKAIRVKVTLSNGGASIILPGGVPPVVSALPQYDIDIVTEVDVNPATGINITKSYPKHIGKKNCP